MSNSEEGGIWSKVTSAWRSKWRKVFIRFSGVLVAINTAFISATSFGKLPTFVSGSEKFQKEYLSISGWIVLGLLAILYGISLYFDSEREETVGALESEIEELESEKEKRIEAMNVFAKGYMLDMADNLNFDTGSTTDRITIYSHYEGEFYHVQRHSKHPDYNGKGRGKYPDDQGCIGKAWREGEWLIADVEGSDDGAFPDPDKSRGDYIDCCIDYGFDASTVDELRMKSRFYYGRVVRKRHDENPVAVIIVESTQPDRWGKEELRRVFDSRLESLRDFVRRIGPLMPGVIPNATSTQIEL